VRLFPILLHLAPDDAERESLQFLDAPPLWVVVLIVVPAAFVLARLAYGFRQVDRGGLRAFLVALRAAALLGLAAILFRPVQETTRYLVRRAPLAFLLDDSASMRRVDSYPDSAEHAALARAAGLAEGAGDELPSRADLSRKVLAPIVAELRERYDVRLLRFSEDVVPIASLDEVQGRGDRTRLGEAILSALEELRGTRTAGIVLVSDGRSNEGRDPAEAALAAAAEQVPILTVGVGDPRPPRNARLEIVEAPDVALEHDEVALTVRVTGVGYEGESSPVVLRRAASADPASSATGEVLAQEEVRLEGGSGRLVTLTFTPEEPGEWRLVAEIPKRPGETLTDDNVDTRLVRVRPEKIRVLYVEGYPRWEYRYLKNLLLRTDRNVLVQCYLLSATSDFPQEATPGPLTPPLQRVPTSREELLDRYDVILLGDVPPQAIGSSPSESEEFLASVKAFVEAGGGFCMIAGEYDAPRSYVDTPIADLLPVVVGGVEEEVVAIPGPDAEFRPRLETPSAPHEIVRLLADPDPNRRLWEEEGGLHPLRRFFPVRRAKPGAEVLLRHPESRNRYGGHVLAAVTYVPLGRTMYLGTDETWLWRFVYRDLYHERFWRNAIRYLALGRLRGADRRFRLGVEKSRYELNERVVLEARILDEALAASEAAARKVFVTFPDGRTAEAELEPTAGEAGVLRTSFVATVPGHHEAFLTEGNVPEGRRLATADFEVEIPSREMVDPTLDERTLQAIAARTGGLYLSLAQAGEIRRRFEGSRELRTPVSSEIRDLWDNGWVLAFVVGLLAVEWIVRKRVQLP
jgi:hypothetical protein